MSSDGLAAFVRLYDALDATTSISAKRDALVAYFGATEPADVAWAVYFLTGRRLRRPVSAALLRAWACEFAGLPAWLVDASYDAVGDSAETLALLCARGVADESTQTASLADFVEREVLTLSQLEEHEQRQVVTGWWQRYPERECFVVHKLVTGAFRVGVSASLVAKAAAVVAGVTPAEIAHRLMGTWEPTAAFAVRLLGGTDARREASTPYPFYLATQLDDAIETLGDPAEWSAEHKWDGIRAQLVSRGGAVYLWSRGEELMTERFPEVSAAARALPPGTVLDGEVVVWREDRVRPFAELQTRIGRKAPSAAVLKRAPVVFLAFDALEWSGVDLRSEPLERRQGYLDWLGQTGALRRAPTIAFTTWDELATARAASRSAGVEGVMLKRRGSPYRAGRPRGDWWKWKIEPYTMDAVLVYAQAGHGRRAGLHTDYTFAVRDGDALVPVAKAYSGLSNDAIRAVDAWVRAHTTERFGPVRAVEPVHVFELGFEAIQRSSRHKAGIAVRFPRILRWRTDKRPDEANTLEELHRMIEAAERENPARAVERPSDTLPSLFDDLES